METATGFFQDTAGPGFLVPEELLGEELPEEYYHIEIYGKNVFEKEPGKKISLPGNNC